MQVHVDFGLLIGRMLGASELAVHAVGRGVTSGQSCVERYWRSGDLHRLERQGDVVHVSRPEVSRTYVNGRLVDEGPKMAGALGWTDSLLHPAQLYVWGRPGEDWRLTTDVKVDGHREDCYLVRVAHQEERDLSGVLSVEFSTGRVKHLELMDETWELDVVTEDTTEWDLDELFG
jgi:hypothetical protein